MSTIINKYSDLSIAGVNNFVDNQRYVVYGYGTRFSDGAYPFVLVTAGEGKYTEDTRIAVLASDPGLSYINQEDGVPVVMYTMDLLTADQDTPENFTAKNAILMMDGEQIDFETLKKGDLVVYALNANGQIKDMDVIFKADSYAVSGGYNTLASQLLTAGLTTAICSVSLPARLNGQQNGNRLTLLIRPHRL